MSRRTAKTGQENEDTANHAWKAPTKGRRRSLVETGRKGTYAVRKSLRSRNYVTGGNCRQKGRLTIIDCQTAPTQHQLSNVTDS